METKTAELKIIDDVKLEPTLKEAQAYVGGYVEGISMPNGDYLIINEEGKLIGLPLNEQASKLWKDTFDNDDYITGRDDFVVGNAILIKTSCGALRAPRFAPSALRADRGTKALPNFFCYNNINLYIV